MVITVAVAEVFNTKIFVVLLNVDVDLSMPWRTIPYGDSETQSHMNSQWCASLRIGPLRREFTYHKYHASKFFFSSSH